MTLVRWEQRRKLGDVIVQPKSPNREAVGVEGYSNQMKDFGLLLVLCF